MVSSNFLLTALASVCAVSASRIRARAPCPTGPPSSTTSSVPQPTGEPSGTKYFINFGDSYSQTWFDINGEKPSLANPIGNPPLPGWTASGGFNWVGFMASQYNAGDVRTYNFAYGGATTDAELATPYAPEVLSFGDQVDVFLENMATEPRPEWAPWDADNTIVGVWMGVNDVGNTFWFQDLEAHTQKIIDRYFELVQSIYDAGARQFVLLSVPPTDKTPMFIEQGQGTTDSVANGIATYNRLLQAGISAFETANADAHVSLVDTAVPFNEALDNPTHINNPAKFSKAAKLAIQLIQAGSVKSAVSDYFFAILEAAMLSPVPCTDPSVRADYHSLFSAAQDAKEHFNKKQKNQLATWVISAVVANDLYTDDSFVFSKAAMQIKEAISNLPVATEEDDTEEAMSLKDITVTVDERVQSLATNEENKGVEEADPFGLDALIPESTKKSAKNDGAITIRKEDEEETKRILKLQRKALITCLEIAARRYKTPWCQTVIDILVKHASDKVVRFTAHQRDAVEKLWASIREQQTRRRQGKSVNGKLDVNAFEWLQQKYSTEKISIRHSVGGSGDRRATQWLG